MQMKLSIQFVSIYQTRKQQHLLSTTTESSLHDSVNSSSCSWFRYSRLNSYCNTVL